MYEHQIKKFGTFFGVLYCCVAGCGAGAGTGLYWLESETNLCYGVASFLRSFGSENLQSRSRLLNLTFYNP